MKALEAANEKPAAAGFFLGYRAVPLCQVLMSQTKETSPVARTTN